MAKAMAQFPIQQLTPVRARAVYTLELTITRRLIFPPAGEHQMYPQSSAVHPQHVNGGVVIENENRNGSLNRPTDDLTQTTMIGSALDLDDVDDVDLTMTSGEAASSSAGGGSQIGLISKLSTPTAEGVPGLHH